MMVAVNALSVPETEEITVIKDCLQFAILVALRMEEHPSHHPPDDDELFEYFV